MTNTWVLVVWWIGLIGALIPTLIVIKEVFLILRVLSDIRRLADRTADAAHGIAAHVEPIPGLPAVFTGGDPLIQASGRVKRACEAFDDAMHAKFGASGVERLVGWIVRWFTGARAS